MDYKNIKVYPENAVTGTYFLSSDMPGEKEKRLASLISAVREDSLDAAIISLSQDKIGNWLGIGGSYLIVTSSGQTKAVSSLRAVGVEKLRELCGQKIAAANPDDMLVSDYECLTEAFPDADIADATPITDRVKAVKSDAVLDVIKFCQRNNERVISSAAAYIRPGRLEHEVVCDIREAAFRGGSAGLPPAKSVKVDLYSAQQDAKFSYKPIMYPGRELCAGDIVTIRLQANGLNNYYGGSARAWSVGEPDEKLCELWKIAVDAEDIAAKLLVPGSSLGEAGKALEQYVKEQGCELVFPKTAMYGVGLTAAEAPMLKDPSENMILQSGMVIFAAPRVSRDNLTPLSCGDLYLVQDGGAVRIGNLPRELMVV